MKDLEGLRKLSLSRHGRRHLSVIPGLLVLLALVVAACGQSTPIAAVPTQPATSLPTVATAVPSPMPTELPTAPATLPTVATTEPATAAPTAAPTTAPTAASTAARPTAAATDVNAGATPGLPAATVVAGEGEVELEDFQFRPKVLTVRVGTTVKFSNKDDAQHTVTSDTGVFDSGSLSKGEDFRFTFNEPGEYPYYCIPHGGPGGVGMSGTIIVVP